jgi:DNA-binding transcriptional regulator GbsR (MarR family)
MLNEEIMGANSAGLTSRAVEQAFVDNWGRLAEAFGMKRDLGRAHALIYIALEPLDDVGVGRRLGISDTDATAYVNELVEWGVVRKNEATYATDQDPWIWFLKILASRHTREFGPILNAMRRTRAALHEMDAGEPGMTELRRRTDHLTKFVEDLANLIELFLRLGQKPMAAVMRTVARFAPRA